MLELAILVGFPVMNATVEVMEQILAAVNIVGEQVPEIEHSKIFYLGDNKYGL